MIELRLGCDRGTTHLSWLQSRHSFSFGSYQDPHHRGFASLRVINEDIVQPGQGFGTHAHQDMEIITYVLAGALEHQDSLGNGSVIHPGDLQRMTAGRGIQHSEYNPSTTDPVHFLQVWILPDTPGLDPGYQQISLPAEQKQNQLQLIGSRDGRSGSLTIHQDVNLYGAVIQPHAVLDHPLAPQRQVWIQVARGTVQLNGDYTLAAGDAAAVSQISSIALQAQAEQTEILLFDLAESEP